MKAGMKLATVYVAAAMLVAGCGQSNSGSAGTSPSQPAAAAQPQPSQSSTQKSSANSVGGYKSFKFGMKPTELAKLAECAPDDYDEKIAAEIAALKARLYSGESQVNVRGNYVKIGEHIDVLTNDKEGGYSSALHCKVNFGGNDHDAKVRIKTHDITDLLVLSDKIHLSGVLLGFNDQLQLATVVMAIGDFNQAKLDSLIEELKVKYPLSSAASDVAIAAVNREHNAKASWFFANNSVELRLTNFWNNPSNNLGSTKVMTLHYHDAISAEEALKQSQKGQVSSGDL